MKIEFKDIIPDEMIYGFAGATLLLMISLVAAMIFMDRSFKIGIGVILGAGVIACGGLTFWAYRIRTGKFNKKKAEGKRGVCLANNS